MATNLLVNCYHKISHLIIAAVNAIPEPHSRNDDVMAELHRPPRIWFYTGVGKCAGIPIDCLCSWARWWKILRALCNHFVVLRNVHIWARNIDRQHWKTKQMLLSLSFLSDSPKAGLLSQRYHLRQRNTETFFLIYQWSEAINEGRSGLVCRQTHFCYSNIEKQVFWEFRNRFYVLNQFDPVSNYTRIWNELS